jgi:hypothetical protein
VLLVRAVDALPHGRRPPGLTPGYCTKEPSGPGLVCTLVIQRRSGVRLWFLAFIGFCLLHAGWAFAAPYDGPWDEQMHAKRAAGIMEGEILPGPDRVQTVPRSLDILTQHWFCFPMHVTVPASCSPEPGGDESTERIYVTEARFNPVYYATTGWPLGIWPNWRGIMLSRLITSAMVAALLAFAVVAAVRWTRHRALLAGLIVAITPGTAALSGSINPNTVEIAAGVTLFAALIAVIHEQREGVNRAAVALAGVSAAILVTPRFTGVMWLLLILGVMLVPASWARLKYLAKQRTVRIWSAVAVIATVASVAWTLIAEPTEIIDKHFGMSTQEILRFEIFELWPNIANQMVGVMGWNETLMPRMIYVIWFMAAGLLILGALVLGDRTDRWRLLALGFGTFVPLLVAELLVVNKVGWLNQGRYFMAGAVGLVLLAAWIMSRRGLTPVHMRTMTRLFAVLLLPIHLVCLVFTMARWQSGLISLNPFNGSWVPPYGHVLPLAAGTLGVIVLFVMYWLASRIPVEPAAPQDDNNREPAAIAPENQPVSA